MSDKTVNKLKSVNPYLDGRREWNERYGSYIKQANAWRLVAILTTLVSFFAVGGVVYIGAQSKFVPYIVQVDKIGNAIATQPAIRSYPADPKVIKFGLAEFITDFRSVYPDAKIQKDYVFKAYRYLSENFPSYIAVSTFYKNNSPFERATKEKVKVDIKSVLQMSKNTWQIDWVEEVRDTRDAIKSKSRYRALATITIIPPKTEEMILKNPIGLYIKELTWSKLLK